MALPAHQWDYCLDSPNTLLLDQAVFSMDGASDGQLHYILKIDDALRRHLGHRPRGEKMVQPWARQKRLPAKTIRLKLTYSFEVETLPPPERVLLLAMERPELYAIALNGTKVTNEAEGYWVDPAIRTIPVKTTDLRKGTNFLELECDYHELLPGLEAIYLLGHFGVKGARTITALPAKLDLGDWCGQGLPNYSDGVTYCTELRLGKLQKDERVALQFGKWSGALLGVRANGGQMKLIGWEPSRVDLTDDLKPGLNHLELTVFASRRNVFGPFYDYEQNPWWCNSCSFNHFQVCERQLVPCGLLESPILLRLKR